jgi:PAS domain S-box-containing protein
MKISCLILSLMMVMALYAVSGSAQNGTINDSWRWVHFGPESGLPQGPVETITEDKDSTIWVGTAKGLTWFDGYQWNLVDTTLGLPPLSCKMLHSGEKSGVILETMDRGVYQGDRNGFQCIITRAEEVAPLGANSLFVRVSSQVFTYRNGGKRLLQDFPAIDSGQTDRYFWRTGSGNMYISTLNGLYLWNNGKWDRKINTTSQYCQITNLIELSNHKIFISIINPGDRLGVWQVSPSSEMRYLTTCENYSILAFDSSSGGGVFALSIASEISIYKDGQLFEKIRLPNEGLRILALYYSHNGDLWVGTNEGLFCYHSKSTRWISVGGLEHRTENIHELIKARDGRLWAATGRGIDIYSGNKLVESITAIGGVQLKTVTGLIEDNDSNIWISSGSTFQGVFRWDGLKWTHFDLEYPHDGVYIHKIRKDRRGRLWFLGIGPFYVYGRQPGAFLYAGGKFQAWGKDQGLMSGRVYAFAESEDSSYWFGTAGGLSRWKDGQWTQWAAMKDLEVGYVFSLAVDSENNVWFADRFRAVGCRHPNGLFTYYTVFNGLPDSVVWDIQVDSSGTVWFGTDRGLAAYKNGMWKTYDSRSGLVKSPIWPILPLGNEVYLGTIGSGVVCLHPDEFYQLPPKIMVEDPIVEGTDVLLRWRPIAYQGEPSQGNVLTRFRVNNEQWSLWGLTRELMLHHLSPGSYFFQVQARDIIGQVDSSGQVGVFTIPPPFYYRSAFLLPVGLLSFGIFLFGVLYVLSIKKRDAALRKSEAKFRMLTESTFDGVLIHDHGNIFEANVRLAHMFGYEHADFLQKTLSDLLADDFRPIRENGDIQKPFETSGVRNDGSKIWVEIVEQEIPYGIGRARIAAIRNITERKLSEERLARYREELKALALQLSSTEERERREVATYLHDYISQALGFCKMKLGTMKGEVSEKDILEIRGYIEDMFEKTQSLTFELSPPILYELGLEAAIGSLADRMQAQYGLSIHIDACDSPIPLNDKISLFLFSSVRELLINVLKHAGATQVTIVIAREDHVVRISVMDNGRGFSRSKGKIERKTEGGFGLFNIQERLAHFGGSLEIVPLPGQGTNVMLVLPLDQSMHEQEKDIL